MLALAAAVAIGGASLAAGTAQAKFDGGSGTATCGTQEIGYSPAKLWPPNHKLRDVTFTSTAPFAVDPVVGNDEEGLEKGSTARPEHEPDFVVADAAGGTAEGDNAVVQLRAERLAKPRDGRTYTVTLTCGPVEGPSTTTATIKVPHSRKKS
jgi:hypothetical protein